MTEKQISLCLIIKNEIDGCKHDIPLLSLNKFDEIFAIDGGSTDGTIEFLREKKIKVFKQKKKGLNNAYIEANEKANYENIIVYFPKKSIDPNIISLFKNYFEEDYDLIIASRMLENSKNEEDRKLFKYRKWSSIILAMFVSFIWKKKGNIIYDILHGVKGWKKSSFNKMKILDHGITIDLEMVLQSYKLNLRRIEFPVEEREILNRKTNFPYWSTGIKLLKFILFELFKLNK